jgi:hypothetical protein
MSTATMVRSGAVHLPNVGQRPTRKFNAAPAEQVGKGALLGPLQALVEARMGKARLEMVSRHHSCGAACTRTGKVKPTYFELCSRAAWRLFSHAFGHAPAPRGSTLTAAPSLSRRSGALEKVEALPRLDLAPGPPSDTRPSQSDHAASIRMCAQGDILIERVDDVPATGSETDVVDAEVIILAHGELSGHRHRVHGHITLFQAAALARDIPQGLYVGHLHVKAGAARLEHEEHDAIMLPKGTYRVRRQRRLEPGDADIVED